MTDRDDLVPQCISVCKVPKDIPYEILLSKLEKHFVKGTVKANTEVQGLEDDSNLCRVILLLNDKTVVQKLLQVNEEGIEHNARYHTLFYSETVECEIPEEWQELPEGEEEEEDEDEAKPLPQTRQASGRQYCDDQSGPVSGFYVNYDPPNMNPTGDQGQHVDTAGDNQHQGHPSQHQGQPSNIQGHHGIFQGQPGHLQGHPGNFQGQQGNFQGHPGNFPNPTGQRNSQFFGYPGQPYGMQGQTQGQGSESSQDEGQTPRPGPMPMPGGYYGPPFGYPFSNQPHPTQTGADGDPNIKGQGHPNMQGQMPYGMPPQYYVDEQGRPIHFSMGMPMPMPNTVPNQGAQQQSSQFKGQGHTTDDEGQGLQTPPPPYTSGDHGQTEYESRAQDETSRKDYMDGDTDVSLEEPRPTKIIVTGLPSSAHDDYLQMFFEKKAGCEPITVEIYEDDETEAIIEFKSPDAVDKVLQHRPIKMLGVEVDVEMYIPEPDKPLCTIVVEGPASLMEEEMLELYFENTKKSGGDTIDEIHVDENHVAFITYESEEVAQRVVDKGKHTMAKKELCVRLNVPEKKKRTKRQISQTSNDRDSEPENLEPVRTIEVRGPQSVLNEELLELYFENKKAGGGTTEKIEVYEDVAYITFETEEVAERVANKQGHKINKLPVTVLLFYPQEEEEQEPPRTIKVSGMKHVNSHETVEMYFENRKRADGGPIEGNIQLDDDDDNVAYITFESPEVAHAVASRSHSVDKCDLEVSLHVPVKVKKGKPARKMQEEEIPEPTKTVKVKGMTKIKSTSTLEYYFENKRRSGGGNHTMEICEEDEDIAFFTFDTHEVAKAVSEKSHCIEGVTLTMSLYTRPKPPPQYDDRVLIKGVKSTTTKDCLFNFLEAKSGCTPQSLVHGEKEGDILVLFESCPDFDKLDKISKTMKLEGASLKMSRVAESNCVLVSDLPSNTTRDTIQFYFENHRRSGGGPVLKVDVNQEDDSMIVFFEDYKVAEAVSQRPHKIGEATIKVDLYLPCIGRPQGDGSEARFKTPEPMVIMGVEWQKIKFLLNSPVNKVALEKQLESCHSKIIWPEKGSKVTELTLECMLTPDIKDCRKLAKGWSNCSEKDFKDFIKNIILKILSIINDVWDKVMSGLESISIANPEAVAVFVDREQGNITIVGLKPAADLVINDVQKIIKQVEEDAEKEKQKVKETITNIELIKTKMLLAAKFPTKMEEKYTGVKVKINQTKNEIIFEGLLADVRGVKVDMYEMINEFAHDKVSVSQMKGGLYQSKNVKDHIVRKLKSRKVTAVWEVEDSGLVIYTNNPNHILICKGIIEGAIEEKMIPLSKASRSIMSSELWQTKTQEIQNQYADRVAIDVTSDMNNVHICAIDEIVKDLLDMVNKFLRLNTVIEDGFPLSKSITKLLEQHHKSELEDISKVLQSSHVMISYGKGIDGFKVQGTEDGLKKAKDKLKGLIDRVKSRDKEVRRPGLRVHMRSEEGKTSLSNIESSLKCVVTVKGGSDTEDFYETTGDGLYDTIPGDATDDNWQTSAVRRHAECKAYDNRKIYTVEGDMTELTVDVLVNTADDKLGLTGGLAKVIVNKGGSVISNACKDYIRKEGKLEESHAFVSPGGNLKAKHIVHIVGPVWKQGNENEEERLTEAVFRAMKKADIEGALSIAIPAISCGVYSFPVKKATTIIADAVKNFIREEQDTPIREVYLCDVKGNTVQMFTEALKVAFGQSNVREFPKTKPQPNQNRPLPQPPGRNRGNESDSDDDTPYTTQGRKKPPPGAKQVMFGGPPVPSPRTKTSGGGANVTIGNISVSIVKGEIAKQKIDMIVNTTAKNLDLKNGAVSASLSKDAGPGLQQEVTKNYPNGIKDGEVAMTTGHNLKCKHIVHGSLMNWDGGSAATGALHDLMATCLKMATKESVKSVAFPAIGTGNLGFPRDIVAKEMFQAVSNFHAKSPQSTVVDIKFIVYQKDEQTIKAFETEERLWTTGKRATMASRVTRRAESTSTYQNVRPQSSGNSSDSDTDYETVADDGQDGGYVLGNIRVIVKSGDITQEDTDCIVNSSNEHLDLSRGGVSRALMKKGGHKLKQEAKAKYNEMLRNRIAMTSAPNLPSKKIIHVVAQESLPDWRRMIDKCLEMAEHKGLASIAFPALGTGLSMEPSEIADTMVKAILDLQKNPPANLREVRFVVFQPRMVDDFTKAITKSQGATAKGGLMSSLGAAAGWLKGAVYGKEPEKNKYTGAKKSNRQMRGQGDTADDNQVTFTIYAMGHDIIEQAIKRLLAELERIVFTKKFTDTILPKLDENQRMEIKAIAKQHHLDCRLSGNELEISGISKNVIHVQDQIYSIMRDCDRQNQEVNEAELLSNIVQWFYIEITAVKQELVKYTKLINHRIEKSYKNTDKTYEFQDNDGDTYVIDFAKMEEYPKSSHTDTVSVIRRDLIKEGSFEAPTTWADMKGGNLKVVTLNVTDQEYQDISTKFSQTVGSAVTITKMDRIQNKTLWQQYQAKKNLLDSVNKPGHQNETLLWHGTAPEAMDSINAHGFNRSYCGKNAVAFGDGVYFAVQASYSASPTYARPDPSGVKRMYYCRVLTGEYTMGKGGMRVPPPKQSATAGSQAMYDSVVNNVQSPGMYIIFNDTQAYPEYLIAFK